MIILVCLTPEPKLSNTLFANCLFLWTHPTALCKNLLVEVTGTPPPFQACHILWPLSPAVRAPVHIMHSKEQSKERSVQLCSISTTNSSDAIAFFWVLVSPVIRAEDSDWRGISFTDLSERSLSIPPLSWAWLEKMLFRPHLRTPNP